MFSIDLWKSKKRTAAEAVARIKKGKHIFVGSGAAIPITLVEALTDNAQAYADNPITHLLTLGPAPYVEPRFAKHFRHNAFFIGPNVREAVAAGRADYTPVFLSQIPSLFTSRRSLVDVALISITPPDRNGFVNLGVSVDIVLAAVHAADLVIAQVNEAMPRVRGAGSIPSDLINVWCEGTHSLPERPPEELDGIDLEIGRHVASLVPDGATLQTGIGRIPDATLMGLMDRKDLGVWTEMFSDRLIDLVENGNITGRLKTMDIGRINSSFAFGSKRLYDAVDDNPAFEFRPSDIINSPLRISKQRDMVAINGALQIDLTGQVSADSIGSKFYSGIGGQVDFIRGASMCPGGKPVIAMRSTAKGGQVSRIVGHLFEGAGVVTSRGDVRYVVTEYGIADLWGRTVRERATALIDLAHPDFRADLLASAKERRYVFQDQTPTRSPIPLGWSSRAATRRGIVDLRLLRKTDERKIQDLFYELSPETIQKRFVTAVSGMPHEAVLPFLEIDYASGVAFVAECPETPGTEPEIIGVGRYTCGADKTSAELALVVRDDWQGMGVGTALLNRLVDFGRTRSIATLIVKMPSSNESARALIDDLELPQTVHTQDHLLTIEVDLRTGR